MNSEGCCAFEHDVVRERPGAVPLPPVRTGGEHDSVLLSGALRRESHQPPAVRQHGQRRIRESCAFEARQFQRHGFERPDGFGLPDGTRRRLGLQRDFRWRRGIATLPGSALTGIVTTGQ